MQVLLILWMDTDDVTTNNGYHNPKGKIYPLGPLNLVMPPIVLLLHYNLLKII